MKYTDFVDYSRLDPVKRLALETFWPTMSYPERLGIRFEASTLGQTAVAFDLSGIVGNDWLLSSNIEGLGTKNRLADAMHAREYREGLQIAETMHTARLYEGLGQDTVAMSVNDQLAIGADVFAYS